MKRKIAVAFDPRALFLLTLSLILPGSAAAEPPAVTILGPAKEAPMIGMVTVTFSIRGVPAGEVQRARVIFDGKEVGAKENAPWSIAFDAGEELRAHRLEVEVQLMNGQILRSSFISKRPPASEMVVRLVSLAVTVRDSDGKPARDLKQEDFTILDRGTPVKIEHFESSPASLAVAIVLDTSQTMEGDKLEEARSAALAFVKELNPKDQVMVVPFSEEATIASPLSADHTKALAVISRLSASGGTALYDAIWTASRALAVTPPEVRRVVLLLSDGRDEASSGLEPGSFHTLDEAVHASHNADATVFSVGLGAALERETDFTGRQTTAQVLQKLARSTGGTFQAVTRWTRIGRAFRDILDELRYQYSLGYLPDPPHPGESWRTIQVQVNRPDYKIRTREGYFID